MLYLITGVPGAGKTSFTLADFLAIENRPKYATPVNGLDYAKHNIEKIDSLEEWVHLPDGSAIFCDEAQQFLRPKRKDAVSPEWVTDFVTHRHRGLDFYCTTQHPMFIDIHFRRLVGEHVHYHRAYGSRLIAQRKWQRCIDDPNDFHVLQEAEIKHLTLPKHIFKEYKSTTVDTHKFKIPRKLVIAFSVLLLLGGTSAYLASGFLGKAARCVTQQGSSLSVPLDQCAAVVDGDGMPFDPFRSEQVAQAVPVEPQPVAIKETRERG